MGSIGAAQVAKSSADGSSFLVTFDSHALLGALIKRPPLDIEADLEPMLLVGTAPYVIAANPSLPYRTFADVVAAARSSPAASPIPRPVPARWAISPWSCSPNAPASS